MRLLSAALALACMLAGAPSVLGQSPTAPFVEPPFASECVFHHFNEHEQPPLDQCTDDPLCVEYEKRDITASNGGAVRFLAAEPARFAIAIPKCRYWQKDHWRIQLNPGDEPLVGWDGSYWFNKRNATGGARLANFTIGGFPADPGPVADLIEPLDPEMADVIRQYGDSSGGGGSTFLLGFSDPSCTVAPAAPCSDEVAVSQARAGADEQCGCTTAENRREYFRCVEAFAAGEVAAGRLPAQCEDKIVDCARSSTCGRREGSVTCCRTNARGDKRCVIKRSAEACRAPRGGSASVGSGTSCCDPCVVEGCG